MTVQQPLAQPGQAHSGSRWWWRRRHLRNNRKPEPTGRESGEFALAREPKHESSVSATKSRESITLPSADRTDHPDEPNQKYVGVSRDGRAAVDDDGATRDVAMTYRRPRRVPSRQRRVLRRGAECVCVLGRMQRSRASEVTEICSALRDPLKR